VTTKYVLAVENSTELAEWVDMLMSQEDKNGLRASKAIAAGADFGGGDDEGVSLDKLFDQIKKADLVAYKLPVMMRSADERQESTHSRTHSSIQIVHCCEWFQGGV
jgi:hypothetical protein